MSKKKKRPEDIYYPVPQSFTIAKTDRPPINQSVIRRIVQGAVKAAYGLKEPAKHDWHGNPVKAMPVATDEQVEMVLHLIEALQPQDAIEATLASQYAITYLKAMEGNYQGVPAVDLELLGFGHQVLEVLQKYRSKGAQLISVHYNVNQGQVVNIKNVKENQPPTLEV